MKNWVSSDPIFRFFKGLDQVPEASVGEFTHHARKMAQYCQETMKRGGLRQYSLKREIEPYGAQMWVNVIDNGLGSPLILGRIELVGVPQKPEEYIPWDLFYLRYPSISSYQDFILNKPSNSWAAKQPQDTFGYRKFEEYEVYPYRQLVSWLGQKSTDVLVWLWGAPRYSSEGLGRTLLFGINGDLILAGDKRIVGACFYKGALVVSTWDGIFKATVGSDPTDITWELLDASLVDIVGGLAPLYFNASGTEGTALGIIYGDGTDPWDADHIQQVRVTVHLSGNTDTISCSVSQDISTIPVMRESHDSNSVVTNAGLCDTTQTWSGTGSISYSGTDYLVAVDYIGDSVVEAYVSVTGGGSRSLSASLVRKTKEPGECPSGPLGGGDCYSPNYTYSNAHDRNAAAELSVTGAANWSVSLGSRTETCSRSSRKDPMGSCGDPETIWYTYTSNVVYASSLKVADFDLRTGILTALKDNVDMTFSGALDGTVGVVDVETIACSGSSEVCVFRLGAEVFSESVADININTTGLEGWNRTAGWYPGETKSSFYIPEPSTLPYRHDYGLPTSYAIDPDGNFSGDVAGQTDYINGLYPTTDNIQSGITDTIWRNAYLSCVLTGEYITTTKAFHPIDIEAGTPGLGFANPRLFVYADPTYHAFAGSQQYGVISLNSFLTLSTDGSISTVAPLRSVNRE